MPPSASTSKSKPVPVAKSMNTDPSKARALSDERVRLSIVVPCYNEGATIQQLHERVTRVAAAAVAGAYELVLVNDGSGDDTWARLRHLTEIDGRVVAVNLSRNHGHQLALSAGLAQARGERVLILDADLQDPPELLPQMMALMDSGADVVYGQRLKRHGESIFKRASAACFYRVLDWLTDMRIPKDTGDFRLMSRRVVEQLNAMPECQRFVRGMISWIGFEQVSVSYERQPRVAGKSGYPLRRMVRLALDAITSFSIRPLRIASLLGLAFAGMGALGAVGAVVSWLVGETIPGWTSVMVVILTIGGIQLTVLGIIGEYLGRLYVESKRRPLYLIEDIKRGGST